VLPPIKVPKNTYLDTLQQNQLLFASKWVITHKTKDNCKYKPLSDIEITGNIRVEKSDKRYKKS
jgi:hypothetical protein